MNARQTLPPSQGTQPLTIRVPTKALHPDGETQTSGLALALDLHTQLQFQVK